MPSAFTTILGPISLRHPEAIASISSGEPDVQLVLRLYTEWATEYQNGEMCEARLRQNDTRILEHLSDSYWANRGMLLIIKRKVSKGHRMLADMRLMDSIASNIVTSGDIIGFDQLIKGDIAIPPESESPLNSWRASCDLAVKTFPRILEHYQKADEDRSVEFTQTQIVDSASWWCG